ncbi:FAD-dependent monooxygenase [Streptomyces sp. NPDC090052]|uniref:FAD-dependent monooxygenase n=1 Tax=unclassified Streptomyces TaxID=2593676 RepID=UPI002E22DC65|nr:FAD-dependent monooxygenase [Streptomyces sp. NBC_01020]WSX44502.1 FAD-dependent monooxygenase [Streptomyces sp. NBC_00963]
MRIRGSRVAVVGGSIAGCATAVALARAGCEVTVLERSRGGLRDRGAGITLPASLYGELLDAGYLAPDMRVLQRPELIWLTRAGRSAEGRVVGRQPYPSIMASWALVWRGLRGQVPDRDYHEGATVTDVRQREDGVGLRINGRPAGTYDAVVGADGYRSTVRPVVAPEAAVQYAGYAVWRGDYPADRGADGPQSPLLDDFVAVGFRGGHAVFYRIPDAGPGGFRQNWALYGSVPQDLYPGGAAPIPRGQVTETAAAYLDELIARELPPLWTDAMRRTERHELSINPMYDTTVSRYAKGTLLLAGDAGAIARPHTGAGAVKAIQDACALEHACREHGTWAEALAAFDTARRGAGNALTELGKHLGRMRIADSPDWAALTPADFDSWLHANTYGWQSAYDPT